MEEIACISFTTKPILNKIIFESKTCKKCETDPRPFFVSVRAKVRDQVRHPVQHRLRDRVRPAVQDRVQDRVRHRLRGEFRVDLNRFSLRFLEAPLLPPQKANWPLCRFRALQFFDHLQVHSFLFRERAIIFGRRKMSESVGRCIHTASPFPVCM